MKHKHWFNWKLQTWRWHYTWNSRSGWEEVGRDAPNRLFKHLKTYSLLSREAEESLAARESRECHSLPVPWQFPPLIISNCWVLLCSLSYKQPEDESLRIPELAEQGIIFPALVFHNFWLAGSAGLYQEQVFHTKVLQRHCQVWT